MREKRERRRREEAEREEKCFFVRVLPLSCLVLVYFIHGVAYVLVAGDVSDRIAGFGIEERTGRHSCRSCPHQLFQEVNLNSRVGRKKKKSIFFGSFISYF